MSPTDIARVVAGTETQPILTVHWGDPDAADRPAGPSATPHLTVVDDDHHRTDHVTVDEATIQEVAETLSYGAFLLVGGPDQPAGRCVDATMADTFWDLLQDGADQVPTVTLQSALRELALVAAFALTLDDELEFAAESAVLAATLRSLVNA